MLPQTDVFTVPAYKMGHLKNYVLLKLLSLKFLQILKVLSLYIFRIATMK